MRSTVLGTVLISALILLGHSLHGSDAMQLVQRRLSPTYTLTFVYGDKEAMKSHMEALQFCRALGRPSPDAEIAYEETTTTTTTPTEKATVNPTEKPTVKPTDMATDKPTEKTTLKTTDKATENPTEKPTEKPAESATDKVAEENAENLKLKVGHTVTLEDGARFRSDLLSIHDGHMVNELMRWVLNIDKRQFWIGGIVKMVEHNFREGHPVRQLLQLWTDRTPANFRFLHFENPVLDTMRFGDLGCLSVDYASGKWGVHNCNTPMYFVCETVELKDETEEQNAAVTALPQATAALATEAHATEAHATEAHATEAHATEAHATEAHATEAHATEAHATEAHATEAHVTAAHATEAHATEAHATEAHATEAHATEAHATEAHTTEAH